MHFQRSFTSRMMITNRIMMLLMIFLCGLISVKSQDFSYDGEAGPDHWGEQFYMCTGKHQSPINIDLLNVEKISLPPLIFNNFNEQAETATIQNNGHTVMVTMDFGTFPTICGGPLNETYELVQFHFHWGDNDTFGSEDLINNHSYPIELHMVFYKSMYNEFTNALQYSDGVAVLAYFFEVSNTPNPEYEEFTRLLGDIIQPESKTKFHNPPKLIDLVMDDIEHYFTYQGSLTTPPCTEVVTWIDFVKPIPISSEQITRFRDIHNQHGVPLTHNFRPIQPLNGRVVYQNVPKGETATKEVYYHKPEDINEIEHNIKIDEPRGRDVFDPKARRQDNGSPRSTNSFSTVISIFPVITLKIFN